MSLEQILFLCGGLLLLTVGADFLVRGASRLAGIAGISPLVIGLTVVAYGTSSPEMAVSVESAYSGQADIALGNVVGSNIFNVLAVLGLSSAVTPEGINVAPAALTFDIPIMIAVALACAPIFLTGHLIARWEGALFLLYYGAYTAYLILKAQAHDSLPAFSAIMLEFILPLTLLTLAIAYVRYAAKPDDMAAAT